MNGKERDEHETLCPRCGAEAEWTPVNRAKNRIEILCPDCGKYEFTREEFDQVAAERGLVEE